MYSLALIIFVISEKKVFEHFHIGSNVNLCPAVVRDVEFLPSLGICRPSFVSFSHFKLLFQNHWANWSQT
jgi:hypothetical protein